MLADGTNAYLYGNGRLAEEQPGGWAYHLPDALRSVRQLADASGGVMLAHAYEPYGESLASSGAGDSEYGFTGEWTDGTGLVHLRARYYAPYLKQWTQPDPIVPDPRMPADWNRYAYVRNNPSNYTDPSGRCLDADMDGRCDTYVPLGGYNRASPAVAAPENPLALLDILDPYLDCGPHPSAYEHVVDIEIRRIEQRYGVHLGVDEAKGLRGEWRLSTLATVESAMATVDLRLRNAVDMGAWRHLTNASHGPLPPGGEMFKRVFSPLDLLRGHSDLTEIPGTAGWRGHASGGRTIRLYGSATDWTNGMMFSVILHELGHIPDQRDPYRYNVAMGDAATLRRAIENIRDREDYPPEGESDRIFSASGLGINRRTDEGNDEIWADLFASWAANSYGSEVYADAWRSWVESLMRTVATGNAING